MIKKEAIEYISKTANIQQTDLIEKDLLLHAILSELSKNNEFRNNYCFKGGTCLTKCHFGYYRFSEDLDFTFIPQNIFKNKSEKEIRRIISSKLKSILDILKDCSEKLELDFQTEKKNDKYIEFGGSNKFVTFKIWYNSIILNREQFIKIQINFVEEFIYPFENRTAKTIINLNKDKEFIFLFPEYTFLTKTPTLQTYCLDEVLLEKIRAILTRKGIKTRDAIDIFLILQKQKKNLIHYKDYALKKTKFMLKYKKYRQNLKNKTFDGLFNKNEEQRLLIKPINSEKFLKFEKELTEYLTELKENLK